MDEMNYDKINLKTVPIRKKMLSQWIFPTHSNFQPTNNKREKIIQNDKFKTLTFTTSTFIEAPIKINSERVQTFISNFSVSREENIKLQNSLYGGFLNKISNKNATVYKKRHPSSDVDNVNELNITSFRSFKIRSSNKHTKTKKDNLKDSTLNQNMRTNQKVLSFTSRRIGSEDKLPKIEYLSPLQKLKKIKIKWQKSQDTFQPSQNSWKVENEFCENRTRKNSICPWEQLYDKTI